MKFYKQFVLVMSLKNGVCSLKVHIFNMIVENIALSLISSHNFSVGLVAALAENSVCKISQKLVQKWLIIQSGFWIRIA